MTEHTSSTGSSAQAESSAPIVHEFTASGPVHATIQNLRGDVEVRAEQGSTVRVELIPHGEAGRELAEEMTIRFEDGRLFVDAPHEGMQSFGGSFSELLRGSSRDSAGTSWRDTLSAGLRTARRGLEGLAGSLQIMVVIPQGSHVVVHDGAGDVRVLGELAEVEARSGVGDLSLERGGTQSTKLTTGTGDIAVGPCAGTLTATTGTGDVELARTDGRVSATTGVGDVRVGSAVSGHLGVRTGVGDVIIHVAAGTAAHLDLATGLGERDVRLTPADGAGTAERTLEIQAKSGTGDLRVLRADPTPQGR